MSSNSATPQLVMRDQTRYATSAPRAERKTMSRAEARHHLASILDRVRHDLDVVVSRGRHAEGDDGIERSYLLTNALGPMRFERWIELARP